MNSILSDLYHGELRPNEHGYPAGSDVGILLESFGQNEMWLSELLGGKAKEYLLIGTMTYDSFRDGFILGARLVMEIACGQTEDE